MAELNELENKMRIVMKDLKECVELSMQIRAEKPEAKKQVNRYWEHFLKHFLEHVHSRAKGGEDLFRGISLAKLLKMW
jgi:hypothetical protein